jgi:hypothetical protein
MPITSHNPVGYEGIAQRYCVTTSPHNLLAAEGPPRIQSDARLTNTLVAVGRPDTHTIVNHGAQQGLAYPMGCRDLPERTRPSHILFIFDDGGDNPRSPPSGSSLRLAHGSYPDMVTAPSKDLVYPMG